MKLYVLTVFSENNHIDCLLFLFEQRTADTTTYMH